MKAADEVARCASCGSRCKVNETLCAYCLLQQGIEGAPNEESTDDFASLLTEIEIRDSDWRVGSYDLLEEIGRGGMGVIHRARHWQNGRTVALKQIVEHQASSPETIVRFRKEIEAVSRLEHPNILPLYEVSDTKEGVPYFTMKLARGGSLETAGAKLKDDPRRAVELLMKVARAVDYAHGQGILHRDLKPGNILLDGGGEPYVSDFGLARWIDENGDLNRTLTLAGTPGYLAPEQVYAPLSGVGRAADVYSLGAILFQLLAGRPPFVGETPLGVVRQAADLVAPRLRMFVPRADRDLETICARCLEREPAARYQTAGALADDLQRWLDGRPIQARPIRWPERAVRWMRRNPVMAALVAVVALALAVTGVVALQRFSLGQKLDRQAALRRSVAVAPLLDLDQARADTNSAVLLTTALHDSLAPFGNCQIALIKNDPDAFAIGGSPENIRDLTRSVGARTVLTATTRIVDLKRRISLHLFDRELGAVLLRREFVVSRVTGASLKAAIDQFAKEIYAALDTERPQSKQEDPALRNQRAMEFIRAGDEFAARRDQESLDHALSCYRSAIQASPDSALARADFVISGVSRLYVGGYEVALAKEVSKAAKEAISINPDLAIAHRALSGIARLHNDLHAGLAETLRAVELEGPQFGPVISMVGTVKILGHPDLALRWLEISRSMQKTPADLESLGGDCWADLADDERAASSYERFSTLHPDLPEGWMGLSRLRLLHGDFPGAREIYRQNLDRFPHSAMALETAAQVEFFSRNFADAEKRYQALAALDPNGGTSFWGCTGYQSVLAALKQIAGDQQESERRLKELLAQFSAELERTPRNPEVLYRVSALESLLSRNEQALSHLDKSFAAGWLDYRSLGLDPRFDNIRHEPKFTQICKAMKNRVADLRQSLSESERSIRK